MKKSIFDQGQPKGDMMLAALKQAVANLKAANDSSALTDKNAAAKETAQTPVNPLKLNQVEKRLDTADGKIPMNKNQSESVDPVFGPPPRLNQLQQKEDYYRQEQKRIQALEDGKKLDAFERNLRNELYGEPLAKKPVPMDKGVYDLGDASRNPLYTGGALAKNGARTRGYTDTASDVGTPVRFWSGTDEDKKQQHTEAISRGVEANQEFHDYLVRAGIDIFNANPEQKEVIDLVGRELIKRSVLGTITEDDRKDIFYNTWKYLYSNTRSSNGNPLPFYVEIVSYKPKIVNETELLNTTTGLYKIPEVGTMRTDALNDSEYEHVLENDNKEYKTQVWHEAVNSYVAARREGAVEVGDYKPFYDQAVVKFYENCAKPIYFKKNKYGNGIGESIPIGELIPPYRNDLGAQVARTALELIGLPFGDEAGQGNRPKLKIDCQGLVRWALAEINPEWSDHGIGKGARYQINHTTKVWDLSDGFEKGINWEPGDLIFYMGEETGEIKHVAIFAGWYNKEPYMIEAFNNGVVVNPVRDNTKNNDGEDSFLYQVNRMIPKDLQAYAEK